MAGKPKTLIEIDLTESPYNNDMIHNRGRTSRSWLGSSLATIS